MTNFKNTEITNKYEEVARLLKNARLEKHLSIEETALRLNINRSYLEALENGRFDELPAGLYGKNFLRRYCRLLGIDLAAGDELFDTGDRSGSQQADKNIFTHKRPLARHFIAFPKIVKSFIIVCVIAVCLSYLGFYLNNIVAPPGLVIISPSGDATITENHIKIIGKTSPEATVAINDVNVLQDKDGYFEETVNLKNGLNKITIIAQKKYGRKNVITRNIMVEGAP